MTSVLQIALVILLTIAGSLLLTEARYHGEDSVATKHRHRHHRQEFPHHRSTMEKHLTSHNPEDSDDVIQMYEESQINHQRPRTCLPEQEDDDDDDDEYGEEILDYPDKSPTINHRRYPPDELTVDRRNQRFGLRGHRTRPDPRLHQTSGYPSRARDHVSPAKPNDTKDDYEDDEYVKPMARGHYRRAHHAHHHQRHYPRNNEVYVPRWRNSWSDDGRADTDKVKRWTRRKSRYREGNDDMVGDGADGRSRRIFFRSEERKWRSNDLRRESSGKREEDEDIWKELGDYDDADVEDEEFDGINDDYFEDISEEREKPPYRTYDEIIKRLTDGEGKDAGGDGVKRDYRNTGEGIEKFLMKDAFGNLKFNGTKGDKGKRGRVRGLEPDYVDDYGNDEQGGRKKVDAGHGRKDNAGQVEYPSHQSEPEHETSAPTTSTIPQTPKEITSRSIITITTQKPYKRRNNTTISQQHATNGLPSMPSVLRFQTKKSATSTRGFKSDAKVREVMNQINQVRQEGSCQWPKARVIHVHDVYRITSTKYIPNCAILHRCSDDTGCCESEAFTCVPKQSQRVELYFYTITVGRGKAVEKLSFDNHTECECKQKSLLMEGMEELSGQKYQLTSPPQNIRVPPQKKPCRCPSEFTPKINSDGKCECKCFEHDEECKRARKGNVYFSTADRLCIQRQECAMPTCAFGEYIMHQGKCPKKTDKIASIANYPSNNDHEAEFNRS